MNFYTFRHPVSSSTFHFWTFSQEKQKPLYSPNVFQVRWPCCVLYINRFGNVSDFIWLLRFSFSPSFRWYFFTISLFSNYFPSSTLYKVPNSPTSHSHREIPQFQGFPDHQWSSFQKFSKFFKISKTAEKHNPAHVHLHTRNLPLGQPPRPGRIHRDVRGYSQLRPGGLPIFPGAAPFRKDYRGTESSRLPQGGGPCACIRNAGLSSRANVLVGHACKQGYSGSPETMKLLRNEGRPAGMRQKPPIDTRT